MAEKKPATKATKKPVERSTSADKKSNGFSEEERAAMRERTRELKGAGAGENVVLEKIASLPGQDRIIGERLHALITAAAPHLSPKLWYGMPAYARNGKVVCFFQGAQKFKTRYGTLGFSDQAALDDGDMWPTSFALNELTPEVEARITALVRKASS